MREEQIISAKVAQGEPGAARQLYEHTVGYLTSVCARYVGDMDAVKDVLQSAYIDIFSSIGRFQYKGEGSLRAWMTRIVVNKSLDYIRQEQRHVEMFVPQDPPDIEEEVPIDSVPIDEIHTMIRNLPVGYRTVFNLYVFEGLSHKEIANRLGIKESTSASQLLRARSLLMGQIREYRQKT